jgi:arginase
MRPVELVGVPTDYGTDRRGVDMGPSAIRYADLVAAVESAGRDCVDAGDVEVPHATTERETDLPEGWRANHLAETRRVTDRLAETVTATVEAGRLPLVLGGDHSTAIGSLRGAATDTDLGVVWFDAHGDFNTPATTPSGNVHGMGLAAALGVGVFADLDWASAGIDAEDVAIVGLRTLDDRERETLRESAVTAYPMSEIDERGVAEVVQEAVDVATDGTDGVHVSLDMDWLDPKAAPGVGTPVRGGATYREAHAAMEIVAEEVADLRCLEVVEVNPVLDRQNETADLAVEFAASALGKRVL